MKTKGDKNLTELRALIADLQTAAAALAATRQGRSFGVGLLLEAAMTHRERVYKRHGALLERVVVWNDGRPLYQPSDFTGPEAFALWAQMVRWFERAFHPAVAIPLAVRDAHRKKSSRTAAQSRQMIAEFKALQPEILAAWNLYRRQLAAGKAGDAAWSGVRNSLRRDRCAVAGKAWPLLKRELAAHRSDVRLSPAEIAAGLMAYLHKDQALRSRLLSGKL